MVQLYISSVTIQSLSMSQTWGNPLEIDTPPYLELYHRPVCSNRASTPRRKCYVVKLQFSCQSSGLGLFSTRARFQPSSREQQFCSTSLKYFSIFLISFECAYSNLFLCVYSFSRSSTLAHHALLLPRGIIPKSLFYLHSPTPYFDNHGKGVT
jgi:hypothetical protein